MHMRSTSFVVLGVRDRSDLILELQHPDFGAVAGLGGGPGQIQCTAGTGCSGAQGDSCTHGFGAAVFVAALVLLELYEFFPSALY